MVGRICFIKTKINNLLILILWLNLKKVKQPKDSMDLFQKIKQFALIL